MGSMSSVSDIAMFCAAEICSSSTARSLTMPNCSIVASQSVLSVMADVARPKMVTLPSSGSVAPVTRLTNSSAVA